ncbi:MAG: (2Fe-2S)-binding protein [Gammaproteobacteria bacterium]|nr:(2Fe-2S)-binding protein [Gammaproteobacteria bacterium]
MIRLTINGKAHELAVEDEMPLLWAIREAAGLTGTKFGCGKGLCGACTVHVDGVALRSCSVPVSFAAGKSVTTIEGLADGDKLHVVQQAWIDENVPQCGYCQPGQIMAAVDFLKRNPHPSDDDIRNGITNLCRCGTYLRVRKAILRAAARMAEDAA